MAPLKKLQQYLKANNISALLLPREDEYLGEYVPNYNERLQWLTGFSGSAGIAIITPESAHLFVDGRYTLQAQNEAVDCKILGLHNIFEWCLQNSLDVVHANLKLHSYNFIKRLQTVVGSIQHIEPFPVDVLWGDDRPNIEYTPIRLHGIEYAGETRDSKIKCVINALSKGVDALYIHDPHDVAWLLNIRGSDLTYTPLALCRALLFKDGSVSLFVPDLSSVDAIQEHLGENINILNTKTLYEAFSSLTNVQVDSSLSAYDMRVLGEKAVLSPSPIVLMRAVKNDVEISGMRTAHEWDGKALTQFINWIQQESPSNLTEAIAANKLETFRQECPYYFGPSFPTISGFAANGAIVHYRHNDASSRQFEDAGLYLVDSGGQYLQGTTDVTRTIYIGSGEPTNEQKQAYTRVLKGHLRLANAVFPVGTTGHQLDALARYDLWQVGLDYAHGTGHGVGSYLSVHEGPQSISPRVNATALKPGMVLSNEPGFYKEGEFGIRLENLVLVKESKHEGFLCFETLTQAPYDERLIDFSLLNDLEIQMLNL